MLPDPANALWLVLLGGWMAVDGTSVGQIMVSRPLVAATLAGWIVGSPGAGLTVGLLLELFHLAVLPVGAARFPEGGPAAVVAGALYGSAQEVPGALLVAVAFALVWEWVGGATLRVVRQINIRVVGGPDGAARAEHLQLRHLSAIMIDFLRGVLVVGIGLLCLTTLLVVLATRVPLDGRIAGFAVATATIGLFAATIGIFPGRAKLFLTGAAVGLVFVLLRG